ncbi:Cytosolic Fe-S cluster assembly factor NUBP2 [Nymphon striatum]|nr:Cytosolic Fe-S cluster assembly factor NUBP2 [Nymphon striatum]
MIRLGMRVLVLYLYLCGLGVLLEFKSLSGVKHIILVLSGKGGVGKSTVASQLAIALKCSGHKVGILDIDLCGPSIPKMLNLEDKTVHQCPEGWVPVFADSEQRLSVMSIGFLLASKDDAVVWRGPKKHAMIKQFLTDVFWGELDYLIIDTPPGLISIAVAVGDVRRELTFCIKTNIPVLGIIENMSGFVCPNCSECTNIFSKGGGESLASISNVPFLGCVPLDPELAKSMENGESILEKFPNSQTSVIFKEIMKNIEDK